MADIPKFTVVKTVGATSRRASVQAFDPDEDSAPALSLGQSVLGVTMTASDSPEGVSILRDGYMRGITSSDVTGWEPSTGAQLWCGASGKVTTIRPTTGALVLVGRYLGGGDVDVHVRVIPAISELSFVKRETPVEFDVFIWDPAEGLYVPRQIDHNTDLASLTDGDPHTQYAKRGDMGLAFMFMGAS